MGAKINLYNLGTNGNDLTRSIIHAEDGTLRQTQNAVPDMRGEFGGLAKRDGLLAINSVSAGGAVNGVVAAPLPGNPTRVYMGMIPDSWLYFPIDDPTSYATYDITNDAPLNLTAYDPILPDNQDAFLGSPGRAATYQNNIYFVPSDLGETVLASRRRISVWDGYVGSSLKSRVLVEIPINPDVGSASTAILSLMVSGDYLYVSVWDTGNSSANLKGSVYRVDPRTGAMIKLGATFPTGFLPYSLCWYNGRLWCGTYSDDSAVSGRVYWIRPGIDSAWTLDHTSTAGQGEILALASYRGLLYAACRGSNTLASLVKVRAADGTWSTSQTGGATTANQYYTSLVVFQDKLYASYYDHDAPSTIIQKFDGSAWSTALSPGGDEQPYQLYAFGSKIFAMGLATSIAAATGRLAYSSDGTTWTETGAPFALGRTLISVFAPISI